MRLSASAVLAPVITLSIAMPGAAAAAPRHPAAAYVTIDGSGSSWQSVGLEQWAEDVEPQGLTVNFNPDGSAFGRDDYIAGDLVDFAASDVPFRDGHDKLGGTVREVVPWGYSYIPGLATGIAFVYHLSVGGHPVSDLRLSARTLMEIFTGQLTNWDSPQITQDNGHRLPDLPIIPVVHSEGAGTTFFFSSWLATEFPSQWNAFCARVTRGLVKAPCGPTEFYPVSGPGWHPVAENGSDNVVTYVTSSQANGAIGYDEYAYAFNASSPVARIGNPAGRYVLPGPANVTAALTQAKVNENPHSATYLQENLTAVYSYKDPLSYPLSYYGYLIVPRSGTKLPPIFTTAVGQALSLFILFGLCTGQRQAAPLGYAPLPPNLVSAGLLAVARIPGHVPVPRLSRCDGQVRSLPG